MFINIYLPSYELPLFKTREDIEKLIDKRNQARISKNFTESDRIRDELKNEGIILTDQKDGTTTWDTEYFLGQKIFSLEFKVPQKINVKMSYPNPTYLRDYSLNIYSKYPDKVWIEGGDNEHLVNNFQLATNFTLYQEGKKIYLINDWNEKDKTMLVRKNNYPLYLLPNP